MSMDRLSDIATVGRFGRLCGLIRWDTTSPCAVPGENGFRGDTEQLAETFAPARAQVHR
jgi:hypothetical protein